ncbi:MAG: thioredoxin domain-containing protein [Bacteroidales bacterium]|nr:thioredoxin domain-containing protein [Bacteroidales bacterium]
MNHLSHENSPYLLQHATNPVDWYPWGEEALDKARKENKLLIISIGYAACHWCHVMETECFEDEEVARMMNDHFVSVKVDREERPDIDQVYMNACFVMTGRGGWPLNVIALPDERPVYAGTYFSKRDWIYILRSLSDLQRSGDKEILREAEEVTRRLKLMHKQQTQDDNLPDDPGILVRIFHTIREQLDFTAGGTMGAPKFPMPAHLRFLLRYAHQFRDEEPVNYLNTTLNHMALGGIYDQLGGGFCRYSVDTSWRVPHFEKMLYDNAQLITLYAEAYQKFQNPLYRRAVEQTLGWIKREMTSPEGLWYASLDADSEGTEGTYYVWSADEVDELLGERAGKVKKFYGITREGNFEHGKNILFALYDQCDDEMELLKNQLLQHRSLRVLPALDDKIITSWNGMMIQGLLHAWQSLGNPDYLEAAVRAGDFYRKAIGKNKGEVFRIYKHGRFSVPGFLDDYAWLITAFLELYQSTFDDSWLDITDTLIRTVQDNFKNNDSPLFRYTSKEVTPLIDTPVETTDQVIPSSNSELAKGLCLYGILTGNEKLQEQAGQMLAAITTQLFRHPLIYGNWAMLLTDYLIKPVEIAIVGKEYKSLLEEMYRHYLPGIVLYGGADDQGLELLKGKWVQGKTLVYLCRGKSCLAPLESVEDAVMLLDEWRAGDGSIPNLL